MTYDPIFMLTVFKLKDQNYSLNNIVKSLKIRFNNDKKTPKKSIIGLWIKLYKKNLNLLDNKLSKLYSSFNNKKKKKCVDIDIITYILNLVRADPFIQRNNIKLLVLQKFNIKISLSKISIIYRKLKLTWKKHRKYCVKR